RYLGRTAEEAAELTASLEGFEAAARPSLTRSTVYAPVRQSAVPAVLASVLKTALILAAVGGAYMAYLNYVAGKDSLSFVNPPAHREAPVPAVPAEKSAVPAPSAPAAPGTASSAAPAAPAPAPEPVVTAEALRKEAEKPAAPAASEVPAEAGNGPQKPQAGPDAQKAPAPETPPLPDGMHQVEVISESGDCWMGFEPDGKKQQRTLRKGDTFSMTFRDSLVIRLGNSQAVRVIYDGRELDGTGSPRVVTLTFPPRR
ncbi:MAG: DUF4115 domain-containing protein, partial [Mailhella sp.]|nr:DUF4115 domain-containing protein [Mailhella sp.]